MSASPVATLHHRRRWYYVLWTSLLIAAASFWIWMERPASSGTANLTMVLVLRGAPPGGRASLWVGPTRLFPENPAMTTSWEPISEGKVATTSRVHLSLRHLGQGYLLKKTDDLAVLTLDISGQRRYLVYDLRDDIRSTLLQTGRIITISFNRDWDSLQPVAHRPDPSGRLYIGW